MRENLLKKQPTWGLRRAQGTGQKSATPATLTKVILVLLTMFLLPSAAWGQDPAIEILYNSELGKLFFWSESASKVIYQWDNGTQNEYTIGSGADNGSPVQAGTLTYWANGDEDNKFTIIYYGLIIGDTPLTNNNVDGEGAVSEIEPKISFTLADESTSTPATLTLDNANFGPSLNGIIWCGNGALKIQFSGNSIINTRSGSELNADNGYCILGKSSSDLILSASNNASTLTLSPNNGGSGNSRAAISGFTSVSLDEGWGMYYTDNYTVVNPNTSPTAGKEVILSKGQPLGLSVAGVVVTSENKENILGDNTVSFTPATIGVDQSSSTPATLTLNKANITGSIIFNADLTVHLIGDNTITKPENISYAFDLGNTARDLNFSTDETKPGTLKIVGSYSGLQNHGIIYYGQIKGGSATIGTTGDVIWKQTFITDATPSYFILSLNKHYNLWKNGHQYHDLILDNNDSYVFNPEKSTLTIINSSSSDYINSGLEDLTIIVSGSQSLSHIAFGAPAGTQAEGITTGTLTIKKNETSSATVNELTLANADGGVISGFSSVTIVEPMGVKSQSPSPFTTWEGTRNAIISDEVLYDLWVGGVQVTSGNASNIIGTNEFNDPLAVFDAETSTLTLKDADIMVTEEGGGAVVSGLENLTVKFEGSNFIGYGNLTTFYGFKAQEGKTHNITFTASEGGYFMTQAGKDNAVFGFNKVTYNDGLVAYMDDGSFNIKKLEPELFFDIENDNNLKPVAISIKTVPEVTLVSQKIAYAIDYADENIADVPETEYTDVIPLATITAGPCTVSAYTLTLDGENTKSNNTDGYYFAYKESELTIGIGATVDLKDYLLPALPEGGVLRNSTAESQEYISIKEGDYTITGNANGATVVKSFAEGEDNFTVFNQILESEDFELKMYVTVKDVISDNTFSSGQSYGTFFNTTEAYNVPEGLKAYIITNVNEAKGTIEMTETSVLPPNTPVLMYRTSTTVSPNYVFTKASNVEPATTKLKYTTTDKPTEESSKLYVLYNGQFVKVTSGTKILANHCYLDLANTSSGTRSYYDIDGSDGTTGIREVKSEGVKGEKLADGAWHDLQGRKFTTKPTKPGLYILNGKKVVIK